MNDWKSERWTSSCYPFIVSKAQQNISHGPSFRITLLVRISAAYSLCLTLFHGNKVSWIIRATFALKIELISFRNLRILLFSIAIPCFIRLYDKLIIINIIFHVFKWLLKGRHPPIVTVQVFPEMCWPATYWKNKLAVFRLPFSSKSDPVYGQETRDAY